MTRGINSAVQFLLSTSHSERCYISQYLCGSDLANLGYESTNTIFVRVFLDSGSELTPNTCRSPQERSNSGDAGLSGSVGLAFRFLKCIHSWTM